MPETQITPHPQIAGVYRLRTSIVVDHPIDEVFEFFSAAHNLETITPPWLKFHVETPEPIELQEGALIDYHLRVHGVPLRWQSEILDWNPPYGFVDEQRRGPYRLWRHEHTFAETEAGTLVEDQVDYAVPGGWLVHQLFVRGDLEQIFGFRSEKLREIFDEGRRESAEPCLAAS